MNTALMDTCLKVWPYFIQSIQHININYLNTGGRGERGEGSEFFERPLLFVVDHLSIMHSSSDAWEEDGDDWSSTTPSPSPAPPSSSSSTSASNASNDSSRGEKRNHVCTHLHPFYPLFVSLCLLCYCCFILLNIVSNDSVVC